MAIDFSNNEPFIEEEPLVTTSLTREDENEYSLRPQKLREYIGQEKAKANLEVFIQAAKMRSEPLDHVLLHGPPGLGKTTLSGIIANEMGVNVRITSGPAIEKAGDLAALLTNLNENDILFVDEIHRLNRSVEEVLYPAMEDFAIDIIIGKGPSANSIRLDLPKFTLIGATTRAGQLLIDDAVSHYLREVPHPAKHPVRDSRRTPAAACDFHSAVLFNGRVQDPGGPSNDHRQLFRCIELQPQRHAEPVS